MKRDLDIPEHEPAPAFTNPLDLAFFAANPERRYRIRPVSSLEKRTMPELPPLSSDQQYVVIITKVGNVITSMLARVRFEGDEPLPDNDDDIDRLFRGPRSPVSAPDPEKEPV